MAAARRGAAVALALLAAAPAFAATVRSGQPVMGTVLEITVVADTRADAETLLAAAFTAARRWDDLLTTWRPEGELAQLNARAGQGAVAISPALADALRRMQVLATATGGAFDPAVGPLVARWRGSKPPVPPPAASPATRLATALTLDGERATLVTGAALDAGGVGKGMALDAAAAVLRRGGAHAAFLDFGGSSQLALGAPAELPEGWRVAVGGLAAGSVLGEVPLRDAALSTSRTAVGPSAAGPIIDPQSGAPVFTPRLATVRAADATTAEAWTKALIVRGRAALPTAARAGVAVLFEDADGVERAGLPLRELAPANP